LSAHYLAGLSWEVSITFGAILIVTGPTVIMPMLRNSRVEQKVASILKWEGIINDPIGVILAVLSYEFFNLIAHPSAGHELGIAFYSELALILASILTLSWAFALLTSMIMHRGWVPEYLKTIYLFMSVIVIYTLCDFLLHESGLIAVTVFGMVLANKDLSSIEEIRRFKETVTLMLVSGVFILLTARLDPVILKQIDIRDIAFVFSVIFVIRPIGKNGSILELAGSYTHTEPGSTLDQFDVNGYSSTLSAKWSYPFVRSRTENLSGHVPFDYQEIRSQNNISADPTRKDHIRTLRIGGEYDVVDNLFGGAYNILNVELSQGIDALGSNEQRQENKSRPEANPIFTKLNVNAARLQRIRDKLNLLVSVEGQWASNELYSSEEYGFGGANIGRGYDSSEIIGDDAIAGKVELQWNTPYDVDLLQSYQLYSFYDAGTVWSDDAASDDLRRETLTSAGLGVRADFSNTASAGALLAFPINKSPQTQGDQDPRFYFNITQQF
jgi:hypothetical protein